MVPLKSVCLVFAVLLFGGLMLLVPLFKFNLKKLMGSSLFVKTLFWIPIFLVFLAILYAGSLGRILILSALIVACVIEFFRAKLKPYAKHISLAYLCIFIFCLVLFIPLYKKFSADFIGLLITVCFATVLADVFAFFAGNYLGKHKLPTKLNNRKSWEGVVGELAGAFVGVLLVSAFIIPVVSVWLFLPIGLGAIIGDLANSYIKRLNGIKDWSSSIPGHGGFIDRLSSIAGSVLLTYYFLIIFF